MHEEHWFMDELENLRKLIIEASLDLRPGGSVSSIFSAEALRYYIQRLSSY
jgi:hypothetical protein